MCVWLSNVVIAHYFFSSNVSAKQLFVASDFSIIYCGFKSQNRLLLHLLRLIVTTKRTFLKCKLPSCNIWWIHKIYTCSLNIYVSSSDRLFFLIFIWNIWLLFWQHPNGIVGSPAIMELPPFLVHVNQLKCYKLLIGDETSNFFYS